MNTPSTKELTQAQETLDNIAVAIKEAQIGRTAVWGLMKRHGILSMLTGWDEEQKKATRLSYNSLAEILDADYVRTARSKGLRPKVVLTEHVLRNAGVPILTTVVVSLRFSLAILPIVEYIFAWPGIGLALLEAIQAQDVDAAIGMVLPLALLFVLVNLIAELLYLRIDPRLRDSKVGTA